MFLIIKMFRRLIPKCSVQYKDIQEPHGSEDAIHEEVRSIKTVLIYRNQDLIISILVL